MPDVPQVKNEKAEQICRLLAWERDCCVKGRDKGLSSPPTLDSNLGSNPAIMRFVERVTMGGPAEAKTVGLGISSRIHVFRKTSPR